MRFINLLLAMPIILLLLANVIYAQLPIPDEPDLEPPGLICFGCLYTNKCIQTGTQLQTPQGRVYCSTLNQLQLVKFQGESCSAHYECIKFYCNGICQEPPEIKPISNSGQNIKYLFIIIGAIIIAIAFIKFIPKTKSKKHKKKDISEKPVIEFFPHKTSKRKIKDQLEMKMKQSLEEAKKTFKR